MDRSAIPVSDAPELSSETDNIPDSGTWGLLRQCELAVRNGVLWVWLPVTGILLWWLLSRQSTSPFFPPLSRIVSTVRRLWLFRDLRIDLVPSLIHMAVGLSVAIVIGMGIGILIWQSSALYQLSAPLKHFALVLPAPALLPLAVAMFGIGATYETSVIAFGAIWPVILNTSDGLRGVETLQMETARVYGLSRRSTLFRVVVPSAGPQIFAGMRMALEFAILLMVVSEMVAAREGIGYFIIESQQQFSLTALWSGMVVLAIVGALLNLGFVAVERRVLRWHFGLRKVQHEN